jgi:hypothetical protein
MKKTILQEVKAMNKIAGTELTKSQEIKIIKERLVQLSEARIEDKYFNYYIATKDTQVKNIKGTRKVTVPSGTVIHAVGGGVWKSIDRSIETGIESLEGNPDFEVINNMTWPNTIDLTEDIENWARNTSQLIQKDPKNIKKIIANRAKVIDTIRKMLK